MNAAHESSSQNIRKAGRSSRRVWAIVAIAAGLLTLLIVGFLPKPLTVQIQHVERKVFVATIRDEGKTELRERYVISSPAAGKMRRQFLEPGSTLEKGITELVVLETATAGLLDSRAASQAETTRMLAASALERASAQLEAARAEAELARKDAELGDRLSAEGAVAAQEAERLRLRAAAARQQAIAASFSMDVARHELSIAHAALGGSRAEPPLETLRLLSPIGGRVLRVFVESEQIVTAGMPLLEIGDPTDLEVKIDVLSRDGVSVRPGARIRLHQWGGNEPLEAIVRWVEPAAFTKVSALGVEEQRVLVIGDLVSAPEQRPHLGDGFRVEAEILIEETASALVVPSGAVFRTADGNAVFVVKDGRAHLRAVDLGRRNGVEARILSGLDAGEMVIVYPPGRLREGVRVKAEPDA